MREVEKALYWILVGTMGGVNRLRILNELLKRPQNRNNLSKILGLDFKTVQYHLGVLEKNGFVTFKGGGGFSKLYFPSQLVEDNTDTLKEIMAQLDEKIQNNKKEEKK